MRQNLRKGLKQGAGRVFIDGRAAGLSHINAIRAIASKRNVDLTATRPVVEVVMTRAGMYALRLMGEVIDLQGRIRDTVAWWRQHGCQWDRATGDGIMHIDMEALSADDRAHLEAIAAVHNISLIEALQRTLARYFADQGVPVRVSVEDTDSV